MARMVPDVLAPNAPDSERRVFTLLREDPGTRTWTVLHSLGLSSAYSGAYGEIDFVAAVPGLGLVCIEVKGGRVQCAQGLWTTTSRNGDTGAYARSPFQQARDGMFRLLHALRSRFGERSAEARCPLGWMVIFTDTTVPPPSPEFDRAELIDSIDLQSDLAARLAACPSLEQTAERLGAPPPEVLARVVQFLRPDFDRVPTLSTGLWATERKIVALTEEQYDVLDHVCENEASVIHGGAGTGKTMLAVELTRRLSAQGRRVLLTCYNRELGLWLERNARDIGASPVTAGHLHRLLRSRILESPLRDELPADGTVDETWLTVGALAIAAGTERYDAILVDEAQDFPGGELIDVVDAWLDPSSASPRIVLFADFSRQALYASPAETREVLRQRLRPANFGLRRNCRNTLKISAETELLTGSFDIRACERQPPGEPVERFFFTDAHDEVRQIGRALQRLRSEGFTPSDIIILGSRRREKTALAGVTSCGGFRIVDREASRSGAEVVYATVHAFKGLESPAVVLMDCQRGTDALGNALLYVGMTRARVRLAMILPEAARDEIAARERRNLELQLG